MYLIEGTVRKVDATYEELLFINHYNCNDETVRLPYPEKSTITTSDLIKGVHFNQAKYKDLSHTPINDPNNVEYESVVIGLSPEVAKALDFSVNEYYDLKENVQTLNKDIAYKNELVSGLMDKINSYQSMSLSARIRFLFTKHTSS